MSAENILEACEKIKSFFVAAHNIKDALKHELEGKKITVSTVENDFKNNQSLQLLTDLSNRVKHVFLDRKPASGEYPVFTRMSANGLPNSVGGDWLPALEITHKGKTLDALEVAQQSTEAMRDLLEKMDLIPRKS